MTLQELFNSIGNDPFYIVAYFIALPLIALIIGFTSKGESHLSPWTYIYSALIYMVCIPGIFAITLCVYTFFFERQSFLNLNIIVYFLPIISMILTLILIKKRIPLDGIPGFGKISGLMLVIAVTFISMLLIQKTKIWIVFIGSIGHLFIAFIVLFIVFRFGLSRLMGSSSKR